MELSEKKVAQIIPGTPLIVLASTRIVEKCGLFWLSFLSFEIRARILLVLDSVAHEAPVSLHVSRHLAPINQRQLTTCILSDCASCHCDSVTCTWHNCFYCIPLRLFVLHRHVSYFKIKKKNVAFRIIFALYPRLSNVSNSFAVFCLTCLFQCLIKR